MAETLTVVELLRRVDSAVTGEFPGPIWVQGEVSEYRRTAQGAAFFRLVEPETRQSVEVGARGRLMADVDRRLEASGVGGLRSGIDVRIRCTVGMRQGRSIVQLSLLEVDPSFTAGRLSLDRAEVLRRLAGDGSLEANRKLDLPSVPLRIGLVTSRGSAAHADFLDHLKRPGYAFAVLTVQASMQGERAVDEIADGLRRLGDQDLDLVALIRGGGSKLDLAAFDSETVGRAIAAMSVPVISGIGHETDRSVADEAVAVSVKTPTAAAEWIVARVAEFAARLETARRSIRETALAAHARMAARLDHTATQLSEIRGTMSRQSDQLGFIGSGVVEASRLVIARHSSYLNGLEEMLATIGVEPTLRRGFSLVMGADGSVVRSVSGLHPGDRVEVRMVDGSVSMVVE